MKRIKVIIICVFLICILFINYSIAATPFRVTIDTENTKIQQKQTQVTLYLMLNEYAPQNANEPDFVPSLGYEGILEYDKNVFESVTVTSLNDWDKAEYYETTGKILATTTQAKANVKIAQITLKLKENVKVESTQVSIKEMLVSDGTDEQTVEKTITYTFEKAPEEKPTNTITNQLTNETITNEIATNKMPETNIQITTNTFNSLSNAISNKIETEGVTNKDNSTAQTTIPKTGIGIETILLIVLGIVIGGYTYLRYRTIKLK